MRQLTLLIVIFLFLFPELSASALNQEHTEIAKVENEDITIYAKKTNGFYEDFRIDFKGRFLERPLWKNVTNPTYAPQIIYEEINRDDKKELIVILTTGYGTGVLEEEVIVFHQNDEQQTLREVLVDNPMAIVNKNITSKLTPNKAEITIGKRHFEIDVKDFDSYPEHLFDDIYFGSIVRYEIQNRQLVAKLYPMVAPGVFIGTILIKYEYRQNMYQAKSIEYEVEFNE